MKIENSCECCLKTLENIENKFQLDKRLKEFLYSLLEIQEQQDASNWACLDCHEKLSNLAEFKSKIQEKHKVFYVDISMIKEEPEFAEILIAQNHISDFIKEEFAQDEESKYEPEVKIYEEPFSDINIKPPSHELHNQKVPTRLSIVKYICDICFKTYQSKNSLQKHLKLHNPKIIPNNNHYLSAITETTRCHDSHFVGNKSTVEITKPCPVCHKKMKVNSIHSHIRLVHKNERDQICQICGKALKTSYDLKVHLRKHSGERPEICETCGKTFISHAQLYKHRKIRHMTRESYQCTICYKNLLSRFKLKCHAERFHPNGFDNGIRVNEHSNCYHCKICPLKFIAMHKYENHLKLNDCYKFKGLATVDDVLDKDAKGEFKCQECGSILNTMKGLKKHIRFVHPKEPQSCKICFKQLKNPHTLWQHMTLSHKQPVKRRKL